MALTNKGTTAALIESVTAPPPFAIAGGKDTCSGQSIEPKKKCSFDVEFAPATPGAVSDETIDVNYNGASPAMSLSGTGIAVTLKAPKSESFTAVDAGVTGKAKNIELSNSSTVPVTLETAALGAPDPGSFTIASDGCSGQVLATKGKCTVAVEFAPPGYGQRRTDLDAFVRVHLRRQQRERLDRLEEQGQVDRRRSEDELTVPGFGSRH